MSALLCTGGYDHSVRFWGPTSGECLEQIPFADSQVNKLVISPDRKLVAVAGNPVVKIFDISSKANSRTLEGHSTNVTAIGFLENGTRMFSASEDGSVKVWDLRAPGIQRDFNAEAPVTAASLHPNQAEVLSVDQEGKLKLWDLEAGKLEKTVETEGKVALRDVAVSADGTLTVAANNRGTVFVWNSGATQWSPLMRLDAHPSYCLRTVFSHDMKFLATTSADKTINVWDVEKGFTIHKTCSGHQKWVWDCAFSADAQYLVSCSSDKTAKLWTVSTGSPFVEFRGHSKAVTAMCLSDVEVS
jgi:G protein beta subunit-like protein